MKNHLAWLPDDVLRIIVRQTSANPRAVDWRRSIPGSLFLAADGPFASVVYPLVSHITLVSKSLGPRPIPPNAVALSVHDAQFAEASLTAFGRAFTALSVHHFPRAGTNSSRLLLNAVLANCTRVRELTVACDAAAVDWQAFNSGVLGKLGPQLRAITIHPHGAFEGSASFCFETIATNCRMLRKFSVELPRRVSLASCMSVWEALGDTLCEVEIIAEMQEMWPVTIARLRDRCRRLRMLKLDAKSRSRRYHPQLADLYASYGRQLRSVDIRYMNHQLCSKVARACPNLQCQLSINGEQWREVCALGARVVQLNVDTDSDFDLDEFGRLRVATGLCSNLKEFKLVSKLHDHEWCDVFSTPKTNLESIEFDTRHSYLTVDGLKAVAKSTGALKEFKVRAALIEDARAFRNIADANMNIEKVSITQILQPNTDQQEQVSSDLSLCEILAAWTESMKLHELTVSLRHQWAQPSIVVAARIERVCVELLRHDVVLTVNGRKFGR